ncbi:MAG TPA: tetratricopeptide repeat protein [Gammaproteobacteria bacterium]|nr:tetratricopeptide repeat protein [Gammaproteobacteria bacterium]
MDIDALERMLARGQDSPMLRFTLGNAYAGRKEHDRAEVHYRRAVELDPGYSAAWQALGRMQERLGDHAAALETFRRGLDVARERGDMQVVRALEVFVRRLEKRLG